MQNIPSSVLSFFLLATVTLAAQIKKGSDNSPAHLNLGETDPSTVRTAAEAYGGLNLRDYRVCSLSGIEQDAYNNGVNQGILKRNVRRALENLYSKDQGVFDSVKRDYTADVKRRHDNDPSIPDLTDTERSEINAKTLVAYRIKELSRGHIFENKRLDKQIFSTQELKSFAAKRYMSLDEKEITALQTGFEDASSESESLGPELHSTNDVICSFSILPWTIASDTVGRRIANQYIVVQVTLRNLNSQYEFLLHDVQGLLNTQRFYATQDRKIVRAVGEVGQALEPRNLLISAATALGSSVGAAQAILSHDAIIGLNVFQSGVIPGTRSVFPDNTIRQLSRLDDMGFASGATTMVIPKNGSIAILVFLPQKTFIQPCHSDPDDDPNSECDGTYVTRKARNLFFKTELSLRDYNAPNLNDLQEQLHILAAGNHVAAVDMQHFATVTAFTCTAETFRRDFDDPENPVVCSISRTNLDKVPSIRLVSTKDPAGFTPPIGIVQSSGSDTTKATVTFPACSLNNLPADVYHLSADGGAEKPLLPLTFMKSADDILAPVWKSKTEGDARSITIMLPGIEPAEEARIDKLKLYAPNSEAVEYKPGGTVFDNLATDKAPIVKALFKKSKTEHSYCSAPVKEMQ